MPELPEVEVIRRGLARKLVGQTIARVYRGDKTPAAADRSPGPGVFGGAHGYEPEPPGQISYSAPGPRPESADSFRHDRTPVLPDRLLPNSPPRAPCFSSEQRPVSWCIRTCAALARSFFISPEKLLKPWRR